MARQHPSERLDRTAFRKGTMAEVGALQDEDRRRLTPHQRLAAAWVRACRIYGIDPYDPPPMDRMAFRMGKLNER